MNQKMANQESLTCRAARQHLPALLDAREARLVPNRPALGAAERASTEQHLGSCGRCAMEYRFLSLNRAVLDAGAAAEVPAPDEDFFKAVRARIHRGEPMMVERADESWAAALFVTARQLIPAMALLLLLIIGATVLWNSAAPQRNQPLESRNQQLPRLYDDPAPSVDDALDSVMTVEEKKNGK